MFRSRFGLRWASKIARDSRFSTVGENEMKVFEGIIGRENVKREDIELNNEDWSKWFKGSAPCVLYPQSTEEVSEILKYCNERTIAICPQAGNTGLVGGSIPIHDEVILSIKKINKHFEFDPDSGILSCDAGFILQELETKVNEYGYIMPYDLGAKGSCLLGGNIATCAGGIRLIRYGSIHAHLLGLTAVIPDANGSILRLGSSLRKDNTSLHSHHLFLGSEGQLGVVTGVQMTCVPKPKSIQSAMLGVSSFSSCRDILRFAKQQLGEILSSFEVMDRETMIVLKENLGFDNVLSSDPPFNILIETSGSNSTHDREKVDKFLEFCMTNEVAMDGVLAQSAEEASLMRRLRESATLALTKDGFVYKHDVSLPLNHFYELTEVIRSRVSSLSRRVVTYGHMGDGNSHLNVTASEHSEELYNLLYPFLYEWVVAHGGSISAEHGIGQLKRSYAHFGKSSEERILVKALKNVFDPKGIMNPYKFI